MSVLGFGSFLLRCQDWRANIRLGSHPGGRVLWLVEDSIYRPEGGGEHRGKIGSCARVALGADCVDDQLLVRHATVGRRLFVPPLHCRAVRVDWRHRCVWSGQAARLRKAARQGAHSGAKLKELA